MSATVTPASGSVISVDMTEVSVRTALRAFLLKILPPGVEVIRGLTNRVAEPASPDYVVMQSSVRTRLGTNDTIYVLQADQTTLLRNIQQNTQLMIQLDVHGPNSADNAQRIATLFRDGYGCEQLSTDGSIAPLYAEEPRQDAFENEDAQEEERWTVDVNLQFNPTVSVEQDYATQIAVTLNPQST